MVVAALVDIRYSHQMSSHSQCCQMSNRSQHLVAVDVVDSHIQLIAVALAVDIQMSSHMMMTVVAAVVDNLRLQPLAVVAAYHRQMVWMVSPSFPMQRLRLHPNQQSHSDCVIHLQE